MAYAFSAGGAFNWRRAYSGLDDRGGCLLLSDVSPGAVVINLFTATSTSKIISSLKTPATVTDETSGDRRARHPPRSSKSKATHRHISLDHSCKDLNFVPNLLAKPPFLFGVPLRNAGLRCPNKCLNFYRLRRDKCLNTIMKCDV